MLNYTIYSDASHDTETKTAAVSYVIVDNFSGKVKQKTELIRNVNDSFTAEKLGVLRALEKLPSKTKGYQVFCDNKVLMSQLQSFTHKNFRVTKKSSALNLSEREINWVRKAPYEKTMFTWVKGHSTNVFNRACDLSARSALRNHRVSLLNTLKLHFKNTLANFLL